MMNMTNFETKMIYLDLDGTVADLYREDNNWLEKLRAEQPIFRDLEPLWNMQELAEVVAKLQAQGWKVGVITHLPMNATRAYEERCAEEKRVWCKKYMPYIQEFYPQQYGLDKYNAPRYKNDVMILVDDNKDVCKMWESHGMPTINPCTGNLIKKLEKLLK